MLRNENIEHYTIPIKTKSIFSLKIILSFLTLYKLIIREKIEIIHCNSRVTQCLGALIYRYLKIPYISVFHGFYKPKLSRKFIKYPGVLAIAVSNAVKKHLVNDLGINDTKIRVVYNGIDYKDFLDQNSDKNAYGFNEENYLIGILGRISEEKGHFLAVEAIAKLINKYKNIKLLIAGEGKLSERLKCFIDELGVTNNVKFVNYQANDFLSVIDLLLVPSKKEGFGYSIIEAFLKEVPVIAYNIGGIPEIIRHKDNGILFYNYNAVCLANAIEEIILKQHLRDKIVAKAKDDVLYFSMKRMTFDMEKVYSEVLK